MKPPVGKDFDGAFGAARGIDGDEAVVGWRPLGVANDQALSMECLTERGGDLERFLVVDLGEQGRCPWSLGSRTRARSWLRRRQGRERTLRAAPALCGRCGLAGGPAACHSGCRAR